MSVFLAETEESLLLQVLDYSGLFFTCALPVMMAACGFLIGTLVERSHLQRLDAAEAELLTIPLTDLKTLPPGLGVQPGGATMVVGSVVVSTDYFRTLAAAIRKLIGGEMRFYNRLLMRGRREAVCRMMAQAKRMNAVAVINLRLETSSVSSMGQNPAPRVEIIAYGTAVLPAHALTR